MWGRTIGAVFYPAAGVFWWRGMLSPATKRVVLAAGGLLAFQGLLGWYMVSNVSALVVNGFTRHNRIFPQHSTTVTLTGLLNRLNQVKSGLEHENFLGPCDVPRVSQVCCTVYLTMC